MSDSKPNVLFLVVDCLRSDRTYGQAGGAVIPTLESLRTNGTSFMTTVSSAANTSPSFASLMTSLFGFRHGVRSIRGYKLREGVRTLPEVMREQGYHTCAEVSGPLLPNIALTQGFDEYNYRARWHTVFASYMNRLKRQFREMKQPWFMLLHLWALHRPRKIRMGWNDPRYGETIYDRSLSSVDDQIGKFLAAVPMDDTLVITTGDHGERMNEGDNHWQSHRTACPIRALEPAMDQWHNRRKKRRMRKMKRQKIWQGAEGGKCHGFHVYDDVTRVPLIFTGPGAPAGMEIPDFVRHVDIGPTILDLVGIDKPDDFGSDGRSLMPLIRGESMEPPVAYIEATGTNLYGAANWIACVRTDKMKYCKGLLDPEIPEELYDLEKDPTEQVNLAPDDSRIDGMRKIMDELAGDLAVDDIVTNLSEDEMAELDDTLRALGYLE